MFQDSNKYNLFQSASTTNKYYNSNIAEQVTIMSSGSNKLSTHRTYLTKKNKSKEMTGNLNTNRINSNSSIYTKTTNISSGNNNKDLIYLGINQCDDEINNLNVIENLLLRNYENNKKKNRNRNAIQSCKVISKQNSKINNQVNYTSYQKTLFNDKKYKNSNKSLDFKANIIANTNKI